MTSAEAPLDASSPGHGPNAQAQCDPVFVVGMNGSGTTALLDCLGRHPALYAFPRETRLIPYLMARETIYGELHVDANFRRLWDVVRSLAVFSEANGDIPVPLPSDWCDHTRSLAAVLDAVFGYFAARHGKRRWCEKTPQHVQHLLALATLFSNAKFIHVIRDGRDCAASFHRRWMRTPELTILRWKKTVSLGRVQGRSLEDGRYMEVSYENLTTSPETVLRRICRFLGEEFDEAILESSDPYLLSEEGDNRSGLRPNSGKWQSYFPPKVQQRLERIAGRVLAEFGYPTWYQQGDYDVPAWRCRYWSFVESWRQYTREIRLKLKGDVQRPWRVILRKPLNALRQRRHNEY